jgi:hypothetical protein
MVLLLLSKATTAIQTSESRFAVAGAAVAASTCHIVATSTHIF